MFNFIADNKTQH